MQPRLEPADECFDVLNDVLRKLRKRYHSNQQLRPHIEAARAAAKIRDLDAVRGHLTDLSQRSDLLRAADYQAVLNCLQLFTRGLDDQAQTKSSDFAPEEFLAEIEKDYRVSRNRALRALLIGGTLVLVALITGIVWGQKRLVVLGVIGLLMTIIMICEAFWGRRMAMWANRELRGR